MQPVSGVLSTQKARTPGWDSQHLYTGDALLTRLDTASAEASCASSSELSPCSMRFATIRRRLCCSAVRGVLSCYSSDIPLLQILCNPSRSVLYCHSACISLERTRLPALSLGKHCLGVGFWLGFCFAPFGCFVLPRMLYRCFVLRIFSTCPTLGLPF